MEMRRVVTTIIAIFLLVNIPAINSMEIRKENVDENQYALLVGFGAGSVTIAKDAIDMKNLLVNYGWKNESIKTVLCSVATKKNILDSINLCFEEVGKSGSTPLAVELAKFISPRTRQLLDFKTTHNSACAAYPDSLVN